MNPKRTQINRNQRKKAMTNTQRTQRRRKRLQRFGNKEIRFECSAVEKCASKKVADAMGYANSTEYFRGELLKNAEEHGVDYSAIAKELEQEAKEKPQQDIADEKQS